MKMSEKRQTRTDGEWKEQTNFISQLYVDKGLSHEDIAKRLEQIGFRTTPASIKSRLTRWNVKKYKPADELRLLARRLLYLQKLGHHATFTRLGITVPRDSIDDYIEQNPTTKASNDPLPAYIQVHLSAHDAVGTNKEYNGNNDKSNEEKQTSGTATVAESSSPPTESMRQSARPAKKRRHVTSTDTQLKEDTTAPLLHRNDQNDDIIEVHREGTIHSNAVDADHRKRQVEEAFWTLERVLPQMGFPDGGSIRGVIQLLSAKVRGQADLQPVKESTDLAPLHLLARQNDKELAEDVLLLGAAVNVKGGLEYTPLHIASMYGSFDVLSLLLLQDNVNVNAIDAERATPLLYTIYGPAPEFRHQRSGPALDCALLLIRHNASVDLGTLSGRSALHLACAKEGLGELVKSIAGKTTRLNDQDRDGKTAIHTAIYHQNEDYISALMHAGANLNIPDNKGKTPVHVACLHASAETLSTMIAGDVDFTAKDRDDETILHLVCKRNLHQIATAVAEKPEVDINAKCRGGKTPLIIAAASGHFEIVRMLVEKDADLKATDQALNTAFTIAIRNRHKQIAKYLTKRSPLEPKNQTVKKWKVELEHDRRVQQALSVPTVRGASSRCRPDQPNPCDTQGHLSRMDPNILLQNFYQPQNKGMLPPQGSYSIGYGEPSSSYHNTATTSYPSMMSMMAGEPMFSTGFNGSNAITPSVAVPSNPQVTFWNPQRSNTYHESSTNGNGNEIRNGNGDAGGYWNENEPMNHFDDNTMGIM